MDVGVDEARHDEPAARVHPLAGGGAAEITDGGHRAGTDSDIGPPPVGREPARGDHEVERFHARENTRPLGRAPSPRAASTRLDGPTGRV